MVAAHVMTANVVKLKKDFMLTGIMEYRNHAIHHAELVMGLVIIDVLAAPMDRHSKITNAKD
jgi:hypothetical protein